MKCQRCQNREATILIKQFMNGKGQEYKLCQVCMQELGFAGIFGIDLDNLSGKEGTNPHGAYAANAMNMSGPYNSGVFVSGKHDAQVCSHCNTTLDDIRKKGRLGCSYCYETFEEQLSQVFRRIQSGDTHRGRQIAQSKEKNEINKIYNMNEELQRRIKEAVEIEDYESAAKWKMMIMQNKERIESLEKAECSRIHEIDLPENGKKPASRRKTDKPGTEGGVNKK